MEKINIAELLKGCPKGMELDCTMFDGVYFDHVDDLRHNQIKCYVNNSNEHFEIAFDENGKYISNKSAKCVIFPKGKTSWEGFVPPCRFKDGDVLVHTQNQRFVMSIYHKRITDITIKAHCILWDINEGLSINKEICCYLDSVRFATEEEKEKLFQAIKNNGYKWNEETKTLEKLQVTNKELQDLLNKYPHDAIVSIEYCNIRELRYIENKNLIVIE